MAADDVNFFEFRHVDKGFAGRPVLRDLSFDVRRGECLCILGRSGVGKSVTLKLLMGFLQPDHGVVCALGQDLARLTEAELTALHKKYTLVFQSGALFDSLTVGENVAFPLRERTGMSEDEIEQEVCRLLEMLDLGSEKDNYPGQMSTGMKRAVAIARALAARPEAILYDEPTTMVDPVMVQTIASLILRVKRQFALTTVVVTHDTALARKLADRLVLLHEGQARFYGTVAALEAEIATQADPVVSEFFRQDEMALP